MYVVYKQQDEVNRRQLEINELEKSVEDDVNKQQQRMDDEDIMSGEK